ncbi:hypothetical protein JTB14_029389 [Gonioctena quinquepunctata]|nr:hypothetical protein JTB14_029389 [Gonioctena quinquepunctata]
MNMLKSLEDYVVEMENRSAIDQAQAQHLSEDVWTQLQQKENDLQLAAELGKALLEKNEELKKQQEALVEEYSKKLEIQKMEISSESEAEMIPHEI